MELKNKYQYYRERIDPFADNELINGASEHTIFSSFTYTFTIGQFLKPNIKGYNFYKNEIILNFSYNS